MAAKQRRLLTFASASTTTLSATAITLTAASDSATRVSNLAFGATTIVAAIVTLGTQFVADPEDYSARYTLAAEHYRHAQATSLLIADESSIAITELIPFIGSFSGTNKQQATDAILWHLNECVSENPRALREAPGHGNSHLDKLMKQFDPFSFM